MSAQGKWRIRSDAAGLNCKVDDAAGRLMALCSTPEIARAVVAAHNAQCEAEPVAWQWGYLGDKRKFAGYATEPQSGSDIWCRPLYTAPPPPASAVAKVEELRDADAQTALAAKDARIAELEEELREDPREVELCRSSEEAAVRAANEQLARADRLEAQLQAARAAGTREDGLREALAIVDGPSIYDLRKGVTAIRARLTAPAEPTADTGEKG